MKLTKIKISKKMVFSSQNPNFEIENEKIIILPLTKVFVQPSTIRIKN